jgi:hypothetical protein
MAWAPPPPPPRSVAVAAQQRKLARRLELRNGLMTVKVPMAPQIRFAPALPG